MQNFIRRPSIDLFPGIKVTKDTMLTFKNDNVEQKIENLVLRSKAIVKGEGYKSVVKSTIMLNEGDILLFEENDRGYIKPMSGFCTIEEAANDLENIKDLG